MNALVIDDLKSVFSLLSEVMNINKDFLTKLDAAVGDGDLGITMSRGFIAIDQAIQVFDAADMGQLFLKAGITISQTAPSTMGTLIGSGFIKSAKALNNKSELNLAGFSEFLSQFLDGMMLRGKAKPGGKTIIDSIYPAVQALQIASKENRTLKDGLQLAYEASLNGLEATKKMVPEYGKQIAHRVKSIGLQDPGATVGMLFIQTFMKYIKNENSL